MHPPDCVVVIPARLGSTRLPRKALLPLAGRPLIAHVVARALSAGAGEVIVATDAAEIADAALASGAQVEMTDPAHRSGTDRIAEVARRRDWPAQRIVVNLQGDEPLAPASGILAVAGALATGDAPMATLATPLHDPAELWNPAVVKVVIDAHGRALYFTRAPVPWCRDAFAAGAPGVLPAGVPFLRHVGIYAYRAGFLRALAGLAPGRLEQAESLEQLRVLEAGHAIRVDLAPEPFPAGVDTPEDYARIAALLAGGVPG